MSTTPGTIVENYFCLLHYDKKWSELNWSTLNNDDTSTKTICPPHWELFWNTISSCCPQCWKWSILAGHILGNPNLPTNDVDNSSWNFDVRISIVRQWLEIISHARGVSYSTNSPPPTSLIPSISGWPTSLRFPIESEVIWKVGAVEKVVMG